MPELPDLTLYLERLEPRIVDRPLEKIRLMSPFLLRSVTPPLTAFEGQAVRSLRRLGKRIVWCFDDTRFLVFHLMIAGRFRWRKRRAKASRKLGLAAFDFPEGSLLMTEASTKKRAWLRAVEGEEALAALDPGGVEPLDVDAAAFASALTRENRTLKRALTDPRLFSGIGNAYSDEILHRAKLSPGKRTRDLSDDETATLRDATRGVLTDWIERLQEELPEDKFPEKVTAFREAMAVHGKFKEPCPDCGMPVQQIVYAENGSYYCARCQTGGRLLKDRAISKLLGVDWPKSLEELEEAKP